MGGEFTDQELLKQVLRGARCNADAGRFKRHAQIRLVAGWIVEVGDSAGGQAAEDGGIVCLPTAVVALADDGIRNGLPETRAD